tara:strand:- start:2029 stop:2337 length:309 start_codon:yes stop_codon:yes gene_type:complete
MPYTKEELERLEFYQNLIDEDEQRYLQNRAQLEARFFASGSADDGSQTVRDDNGSILVFESPYTGELATPDHSNKIVADMNTEHLQNDISIDKIINRRIREL